MKEVTSKSILGPDGLPFKVSVLTQEQAGPTLSGVRSPWRDSVAKGLDPSKLAAILKSADEGDNEALLTLAEEMEERDTHYASVLGQRKRAISLIDPVVVADKECPEDIKEAVERLVNAPIFSGLVDDLMDAPAKGYACVEPMWSLSKDLWVPHEYKYRDPRFYKFDRETGSELRIRDEAFPEGKPIPLYSTIVHRPRLKSGMPVRGGLARLVSWSYMLKAFTLQDWAAFLEVFGMPLRVGKYDDQAGPDEKRTLLRAVRDLGSDAAAIIPQGMEIEFIEAKGGQGNAVFGAMADYLDKQISKAVIGQTMTTDDGSSMAQANVHEDVKIDIKKADARQITATLNRELIIPFVAFNFGSNAPVPFVSLPVEDPEDVVAFSDALAKLVPLGFKVTQKDVRKRIGTEAPDAEDELLVPPTQATQPEPVDGKAKKERAALQTKLCPHCGEDHHLANAQRESDTDALVDDALDDWQADLEPLMAQIFEAAENASGYDGFLAALDALNPHTSRLARRMAIQAMKARGLGNLDNG